MKKLTPSNLHVGTYTTDSVKIVGSCKFHLSTWTLRNCWRLHLCGNEWWQCPPVMQDKPLQLGLIQPRARLDYLLPRASLITSSAEHPKKMKEVLHIQKKQVAAQKKVSEKSTQPPAVREGPQADNKQEMIMQEYPDVFQEIGKFPGPDYHIQVDPRVPPKQTPCRPIPIPLKPNFNKMLTRC